MTHQTDLFTGLRPTGNLTLANYLGAIKPIVDIQAKFDDVTIFVADLHGLTDQEPETVAKYRYEIAKNYMALGLDVSKASIFMQSAISQQVLFLTMLLSRHISLAELMRVPTLKDKLKDSQHPEQARVMLANYPIMMAADILLQSAKVVPVGEDQIAHLEVTRLLARRFNSQFGEVFVEAKPYELKILRIMSLTGVGKMSKSKPTGAILLDEPIDQATKKVARAETALEGQSNAVLDSHMLISNELAREDEAEQLKSISQRHLSGEKVMGEFKQLLSKQIERFLKEFQSRKADIPDEEVKQVIETGNKRAIERADEMINKVIAVTKFNS